jgi:hypothetical protein
MQAINRDGHAGGAHQAQEGPKLTPSFEQWVTKAGAGSSLDNPYADGYRR